MKKFSAYIDRKERENKNNLRTLSKILERSGFSVKNKLDHFKEPYLYIEKPINNNPIIESLTFGGIRIYNRGSNICYRPQNNIDVEPYGKAYLLDIEGMYKGLLKKENSKEVGMDLVQYIIEEVLNYFLYSAKSQLDTEEKIDPFSKMVVMGKAVDDWGVDGINYGRAS